MLARLASLAQMDLAKTGTNKRLDMAKLTDSNYNANLQTYSKHSLFREA